MALPRALLLCNTRSRRGQLDLDLEPALAQFSDNGIGLITVINDRPEEFPEAIRHYRAEIDRVVIAGGDGTLNRCAAALLETGLPLGILPLGTANDLARTLRIPFDLAQAAAIISMGNLRHIDVGKVNDRYFFNAASMGLSARIARKATEGVKLRWGILAYARASLGALRSHRRFFAVIDCDARSYRVHSIQIVVGNGRYYGSALTVAEDASIENGLLFLYSLEPQGVWQLLALVPRLKWGSHARSNKVLLLKGRDIGVQTQPVLAIDADGEVISSTPARFRVLPAALPVYQPERS